ncbi:MAG: hypothetical protein JXA30_23120 [Deltaproteobacteria bacterium]|nr:hypothetical protein [Deltaproteobacteria bacterium]
MEKRAKSIRRIGVRALSIVVLVYLLGFAVELGPEKDPMVSVRPNREGSAKAVRVNTPSVWASARRDSKEGQKPIERVEEKILRFREMKVKGLKQRTVTVYLPPGYERHLEHRYPVLYTRDGQFVFRKELAIDRALERLVNLLRIFRARLRQNVRRHDT